MTLLILGGTAEARKLTLYLHERHESLITNGIYSVAGLVRVPELPCTVVSGGFSPFGGLQKFVQGQKVTGIVDVTHPYAEHITRSAEAVAQDLQLPYWRFLRPEWLPDKGDQWIDFECWADLLSALQSYRSVLFTTGRLSEETLKQLSLLHATTGQKHCVRTAVKPLYDIPTHVEWKTGLGFFTVEEETALIKRHKIDVLVSKNSGGSMTEAKLSAARNLKIPVFMLKRPVEFGLRSSFSNVYSCADAILKHYKFIE